MVKKISSLFIDSHSEKMSLVRTKRLAKYDDPQLPLIDVVTPQPKAFFAYLQMPSGDRKKPQRISRVRSKRAKPTE